MRLKCIYNIRKLGFWRIADGIIDPSIDIEHLQWKEDCYIEYLSDVDIGLVPNISFSNARHNHRLVILFGIIYWVQL